MSRPKHLEAETRCYFVTTNTEGRKALFANHKVAQIVIDALYFLRKEGRIKLHGFVVMPDHLHFIPFLPEGEELPKVMHSLKSFTAKEINKSCGRLGKVWQDGYHDHGIRDEQDLLIRLRYMLENPVRKGIVECPEEYKLSSAHEGWIVDSLW